MKNIKNFRLNLRLFDGEGGGEGSGAGTGDGTAGSEASEQLGSATEAAGQADNGDGEQKQLETVVEKTIEQKKAEFEQLITGEYKDLFGERMQSINARNAEEMQKVNDRIGEYTPLIDMLAEKYGVQSGKIADIMAALDKDNSFYEDAAMKEGMTVEQYKNMLHMKTENKRLIEAQKQAEQIRQRDQAWQRWDTEAEICRSHYPDFDMNSEIMNEDFVRLLGAGFDVESAYRACHFDEILNGVKTQTKDNTKKQVADTIRSGYARPTENQVGGNAASTQKADVQHMSNKEILDLIERAKSGEKIVL